MTAMLEHETLTDMAMDEETRQGLAEAADNVLHGPERLKAWIVRAAREGDKPADIHKVIHPAYTYDYVAALVRTDRKANPGEYQRAANPGTPEPSETSPDGT
ncbi:MAG TPA: hypothetical protein VFB06_11020 [Streptosporangiaceae bacterium]|nr:hypothetical protein [Streptosporangiaceae bacterium]